MWRVASSPIFFQVFPLSSDLYAPSPQEELCRLFGSPVPTHTTEGSDGAMAMSPIVDTLSLSNIGSHVVPLLVVFHTPPEAVPTYTMFGLLSTTAKSSMRPPIVAGPSSASNVFKRANQPAAKTDAPRGRFVSRLRNSTVPSPRATHGLSWTSNPYTRMLGYPTVFFDRMFQLNHHPHRRVPSALRLFPFLILLALAVTPPRVASAQQNRFPSSKGGVANLAANTQSHKGDVTTADGDVDIQYADTRLRADHVEYDRKTYETTATGHVQLDYGNEHLEADEAHYNVSTGHGLFHNVRGNIKIERRPNPSILISDHPLYFEARDVERFPGDIYLIHRAWITICDPRHPKWQFYAPNARIRLDKTVALVNANFRLFRVPLIWLPYASAPAGRKVRESGFLIPDIGQSSRKGFILGDAFYLAPTEWMDATLGVQYMSRRGVLE